MSAPIVEQILSSLRLLREPEGERKLSRRCQTFLSLRPGQRRICQLADNTRYFRRKLVQMGFIVYGNENSPVVPMLLYLPARVTRFNREMLRRGIAVVTVGFPATKLLEARVRFCLSAAHTRPMLDTVRSTRFVLLIYFLFRPSPRSTKWEQKLVCATPFDVRIDDGKRFRMVHRSFVNLTVEIII